MDEQTARSWAVLRAIAFGKLGRIHDQEMELLWFDFNKAMDPLTGLELGIEPVEKLFEDATETLEALMNRAGTLVKHFS